MMQLQFLGEAFEASDCRGMCDNCKTGMRVVEKDITRDSITLMNIVQEINERSGKITAKQLGDICRGKSVTSVYLQKTVT